MKKHLLFQISFLSLYHKTKKIKKMQNLTKHKTKAGVIVTIATLESGKTEIFENHKEAINALALRSSEIKKTKSQAGIWGFTVFYKNTNYTSRHETLNDAKKQAAFSYLMNN